MPQFSMEGTGAAMRFAEVSLEGTSSEGVLVESRGLLGAVLGSGSNGA